MTAQKLDGTATLKTIKAELTERVARLKERGYTVVETPLTAFQRSGGSACCLTLRLDYRLAVAMAAVPAAKAARRG